MLKKWKNMDKFLFLLILGYTVLGLIMVFSASSITAVLEYGKSESYFFIRQLVFISFGYIIGFIIIFLSEKWIRLLKKCNNLIAWGTIGVLILTLICGVTRNGATSWLLIGPMQIQPSEFAKTMTIIFIAFSFSNIKKIFRGYKYLIPFTYALIVVVLIALQPDLGTALILGMVCFFLFFTIPLKDKNFSRIKILGGACAIVVGCLFIFGEDLLKNVLTEEQASRLTYGNPCTRYTEKTGYQVCNGYIAINNGGLFGVGLGNSTQKYLYLPEAYTDFVFPIVTEELGSIVASLIIIGYFVILIRILIIAKKSETLTGSLLALGTFLYMLIHIFVNLLGVLTIIPLTGVPLPFLSYGGSFNMNLIILLFITERVSIENKNQKLKREINNL